MSANIFAVSINEPWEIAVVWVAAFLAIGIISIFPALVVTIFCHTMYRSPKKKRTRECTDKKDESQMRMFAEGVTWAEQFKDITEQLHIVNDGLNQYGEYINFGFDKCAVILQGRSESLLYSYYFADVYAKNGYNILVVDFRANGFSDGKYSTMGIKESDDLVLWIKLIKERYRIDDFTVHGVCIGGAAAIYAYLKLKQQGLPLIKKIVTDGLFKSPYEIFKYNFKKYKGPIFPVLHLVFLLAFLLAKVRLFSETPMKYMKDIDIPILFIWSVKDMFCIEPKSRELFEACASKDKELCFFPEGRHSHVRSVQAAEYDKVIEKFLSDKALIQSEVD
ncbi:MAG: alpha/beta hydrolase [Clostridiales bacterium]|jgi:pimeloyl-ACP methyl ester carboxylesterase|nr:alpha/beta hydrolase [Clostridiales bacterium]